MMKRSSFIAALALGSVCLPASAFAQYANSPFYDHTVELSQAHGLESIGLRLDLAAAFTAPYDDELVETIEGMTGAPLARFNGTLTQSNPELATALAAALHDVSEAVEDGADPTAAIAEARELLEQAYSAVISVALRDDPAFNGGIIINLLLAEEGVAEGLEEAVENDEPWEYPNGYVALQRVKALWQEIKRGASEQRLADGQEMLDLLDTLYPQAEPPESLAGLNPEEAEGPSQRLGGIVEEAVDADLYPGRELPRLVTHLAEVTAAACAVYPEQAEVAAETIYAVFDLYDAHVDKVAGMFAPEAQEQASELFGQLIGVGEDDDDEAAEGAVTAETAPAAADEDDALSATDACGELAEAFAGLKTALGG